MKQFEDPAEAQTLALAIVDTLPDPFLVLDDKLEVLAASRCFYEVFHDDPSFAHGRSIFDLTGGRWDVPGLSERLAKVVPSGSSVEAFEFRQDFEKVGKRTIQLSARRIHDASGSSGMMLVAIKDVTSQRIVEQERESLLEHTKVLLDEQKTLLSEMRHRIANSLQIIASILLLKARGMASEETKNELRDAHQRVMSVAAVQSHLHDEDGIEHIDVKAYLTKLSAGLASSMIGPDQDVRTEVDADDGTLASSHAVSLGLMVTELVINAIKFAFPTHRANGRIEVRFRRDGTNWELSVSDNGAGRIGSKAIKCGSGLGAALISALAKQLDASVSEVSAPGGLKVIVTRESAPIHLPLAA